MKLVLSMGRQAYAILTISNCMDRKTGAAPGDLCQLGRACCSVTNLFAGCIADMLHGYSVIVE